MPRSFNSFLRNRTGGHRGPGFWLPVAAGLLLLANLLAAFVLLAPPGGSREDLLLQRNQLQAQIAATRASTARLRTVSGKVQLGSDQANEFEAKYFLAERFAYAAIITEIQRMAKVSGLDEREAVYSKEPIEGSDDLSLLNVAARFNGSYENLMRFLHEADKSPMLLMLDTLQATPQQRSGQIETEIRFQAIIHEEPTALAGVQP
jgi:hypothetical protein